MSRRPKDAVDLLDLAGAIYASALDPDKTTASLSMLESNLKLAGSQIFTFDRTTSLILESQMCAAVHRSLSDDYLNHWGNIDPRVPALGSLPSGGVLMCHEWFNERFVGRDAYYQDFLIPAGFRWAIGGTFDSGAGTTTVVAGLRDPDQPHFDSAASQLLGRLLPHFQRAKAIAGRVQQHGLTDTSPPALVHALPLPCCIVDTLNHVLLCNQLFEKLLPTLPAKLMAGKLQFDQVDAQAAWESCLQSVMKSIPATRFTLRRRDGRRFTFRIVPWRALASRSDGLERRASLVMLDTAPAETSAFDELIAAAKLTPVERTVLDLMLQGHSAKAIARMRDVSGHTARNQVARILAKFSCHSQRELILNLTVAPKPGES